MLTLTWRKPDPPIGLRWRGLDDVTFAALAEGCDPEALAAIVGPPGDDGADIETYVHTQASAASTWTVNHNLGRRPAASVRSAGGIEVIAQVLHVSDNQLQVIFAVPATGSVYVH